MDSHDIKDSCAQAEQTPSNAAASKPKSHEVITGGHACYLPDAHHRAVHTVKAKQFAGSRGGEATSGAEPGAAQRGDAAAAEPDSRLLEVNRKQCGKESDSDPNRVLVRQELDYEARPCRCKSGFCDDCCAIWGLRIRLRLIPIVETFTAVQMWTLTVDPTLFDDARQAFQYLKAQRCVSELMRHLRERGVLHSDRYFYVIEWHRNGFAHFHLVVDASYIRKEIVQAIWDGFRPSWAGPKPENRPGFGMVRYSRRRFASKRHAAQYVTKYLIKPPREGYPDWLLDSEIIVRRFSSSRGFWGTSARPNISAPKEIPNSVTSDNEPSPGKPKVPGLLRPTIRERRDRCAIHTVLLAKRNLYFSDGSQETVTEFVGQLKQISYEDAKQICGFAGFTISALPLTLKKVNALRLTEINRRIDKKIELVRDINSSKPFEAVRKGETEGGQA